MTDNLSLWQAVETTPPEQTKAITGKAYRGTSPKPYWIVRKATETFGPCGIGWGFNIVSERIEEGGKPGDRVHIAHVRVWFKWAGERGEVEHIGQTMFSGTNKNGLYTDEDAPKKSVTDALVKALSMIGFAGDIFMGRYDDSKYVAELEREARAAGAGDVAMAYRDAFKAKWIQASDLDIVRGMWSGDAHMRDGLGITEGHPFHRELHQAWLARGKALAAQPHERSAA
ncbi:MAG: hypothetical protein KA144_08180 [Xanthomonadaceae bacterium]|nr:hypothetical protein [Xanthomonadaceae bacterium]